MKAHSFILRSAAFLLILVFSQKAGTGLLLHNLFHTNSTNDLPAKQGDGKEISFNCNCIDDFLMPFQDPAEPVVALIASKPVPRPLFLQEHIPFRSSVFSFLRGPPALL